MTLNLPQIKSRIRSVENTKKITRAMEMIAAAKLKRYEKELEKAKRWTSELETLFLSLTRHVANIDHPLLNPAPENAPVTIVSVTSNMGLCGGYNQDLISLTDSVLHDYRLKQTKLICLGNYGAKHYARAGVSRESRFSDFRPDVVPGVIDELAEKLTKQYFSGKTSEVILISTELITVVRFQPAKRRILPIQRSLYEENSSVEYILEPSQDTLLNELIPMCFQNRFKTSLWEAYVSEQLARMTAMRQATKSAQDMIEELILLRNKARQATITRELIEIVTAGRALKNKS